MAWDDPVKMVSDFLWHPGQTVASELKSYFKKRMSQCFSADATYRARFQALFPLYGLIWVLIILNHFIPSVWQAKRDQGIVEDSNKKVLLSQQYEKAKACYEAVLRCSVSEVLV